MNRIYRKYISSIYLYMSISSRLHGLIYAGEAVQEKFPKRPNLFPSRYRERDYEPKWLWDNDIKYNNVEEFARSSPDLNIIFFHFFETSISNISILIFTWCSGEMKIPPRSRHVPVGTSSSLMFTTSRKSSIFEVSQQSFRFGS